MFNRRPISLILAAAAAAVLSPLDSYAPRLRPLRPRRNPIQPPAPAPRVHVIRQSPDGHAGRGAAARRLRQIERGTLNICNGLVVPGLRYLGHGFALHAESGRVIDARM